MGDLEFTDIEEVIKPNKTYKIDTINNRLLGTVDELDAIKQAIFLRLSIGKNENLIYSYDYGIEISDLISEEETYIIAELQRRITEELTKDDRIIGVDNFAFESSKGNITAYFTVNTVLGEIEQDLEVAI